MRARTLLLASALFVLGGCSYFEATADYTEEARLRATIRDEFDQIQVERGRDRRAYIDQRVAEAVAAQGGGQMEEHFAAVEARVGRIETRLQTMARQTNPSAGDAPVGASVAELDGLRGEVAAAMAAVAEVSQERSQAEAATNARLERLEFRTRNVAWPPADSAIGLHLASYRTHQAALRGWGVLQRKHADVLAAEEPLYVEVETVAGSFVRVIIGAGEPEERLRRIRDAVRARGDYAMVMPILHNPPHGDLDQPRQGPVPGS